MDFRLGEHPHRRYNPLKGEWVLVSPHRTQRPWLGRVEKKPQIKFPEYDPGCYLCPGNVRAGGERNPEYVGTYIFTNDFSALLPETPTPPKNTHALIRTEHSVGTCRVLCYSPRHDLTFAQLSPGQIKNVIDAWIEQLVELGTQYKWVQIFENKGEMMGASNPHPHGQIWAIDSLPNEPAKEDHHQREYYSRYGRSLLLDYLEYELEVDQRIVVENQHWIAVVPFWAIWPFETLLLPKRHVPHLVNLSKEEQESLASVLKLLLVKYDNLFEISFPYSMGWHGAPQDNNDRTFWHLHAHFYPPLLRSATVRKFMVGYEMLAEAQRDLTAEQAATRLRALPGEHYLLWK
jgi:UDPglucose--hexose-1-phosphate uridylyltransferase